MLDVGPFFGHLVYIILRVVFVYQKKIVILIDEEETKF